MLEFEDGQCGCCKYWVNQGGNHYEYLHCCMREITIAKTLGIEPPVRGSFHHCHFEDGWTSKEKIEEGVA